MDGFIDFIPDANRYFTIYPMVTTRVSPRDGGFTTNPIYTQLMVFIDEISNLEIPEYTLPQKFIRCL